MHLCYTWLLPQCSLTSAFGSASASVPNVQLLNLIDTTINEAAELCLDQFREVRLLLAQQLQYDTEGLPQPTDCSTLKVEVNHADKILIAEVGVRGSGTETVTAV